MSNMKIISAVNQLESFFLPYTQHLDTIKKNFDIIRDADLHFKKSTKNYNSAEFYNLRLQLSFSGFLTISILDLLFISKNILNSKHSWEKIYCMRYGYLIVYESIKTYNKNNPLINKAINEKFLLLKNEYKEISTALRRFKRGYDYERSIADIRNLTAGHIDDNFVTFYDTILNIDQDTAIECFATFINILMTMQEFISKLSRLSRIETESELDRLNTSIDSMKKEIGEMISKLSKDKS